MDAELQTPSPTRIWAIAKAFNFGATIKISLDALTLQELAGQPSLLREAKRCGFADRQIAAHLLEAAGKSSVVSCYGYTEGLVHESYVWFLREEASISPFVKQIDTLSSPPRRTTCISHIVVRSTTSIWRVSAV